MDIFEKTYFPQAEDCTEDGLLRLLEDAGTAHSVRLGIDHDQILARYGCVWMLSRSWYRVPGPPAPGEPLRIRTWVSQLEGWGTWRAHQIGESGESLELWVLVDAQARKLVPISRIPMPEGLALEEGQKLPAKVPPLRGGAPAGVESQAGQPPRQFPRCGRGVGGTLQALPWQELLLFTPFQPEVGSPYGVSLLRSMPFLAGVLLKIYQAVGMNWERMGNVRFAVVYKPQGEALDGAWAQERSEQIAREWSSAMQAGKDGTVRDFVAVGDVDIQVIGADNQVLDSQAPVRQILEQLVARTGIPPFLLGLSWSATERMSAQQADMMTSEITAIRRGLTGVVEQICELWLRLHGFGEDLVVEWEDINLQDLVEEARAELYREQARKLRLEAGN